MSNVPLEKPAARKRQIIGRAAALLLLLALGVIFLTATFSPFTTEDEDAREERILAEVAVDEDAPRVTIKGHVVNSDGHLIDPEKIQAERTWIIFDTLTVIKNAPSFPGGKQSYYPSFGSFNTGTNKEEGSFEYSNARVGAYVMVYAYSSFLPRKFVSQPVVFRADGDRDHITIQLQEGIPVYGTAMFDDGTPAKDRTIVGWRSMIPSDLMAVRNIAANAHYNFALDFQAPVQADGKYELYLPPGDFHVAESHDSRRDHAVPVSIKDMEKDKDAPKEYRIDLVLPAPLRGKFVKEDGSAPGNLEVCYAAKTDNSTSSRTFDLPPDKGGEFSLNKQQGSFLIAVTRDQSLGIVYPIPDEKLSEFHTVVLKPTATVKLELRDSGGQPVAGKHITAQTGSRIQYLESTINIGDSITGGDGVAAFQLPSGTGYYRFSWAGGEFECEKAFQPGETVVIPAVMK